MIHMNLIVMAIIMKKKKFRHCIQDQESRKLYTTLKGGLSAHNDNKEKNWHCRILSIRHQERIFKKKI
jgi:hypothetical protein